MNCDICGKEGILYKTNIEDSILNVCKDCSKFGKIISEIKIVQKPVEQKKHEKIVRIKDEKEILQVIVPDYAERIRKKREELGLKQEDFAKKINEKISLIHNIETGKYEPSIELARKLEKALKIILVEQHEETHHKGSSEKSDTFTIGDFVKNHQS